MGGWLWRDIPFLLLWTGQTVSELGSQVTLLALPATAILVLHASPFQVGLLEALAFLAFPSVGLLAGVYADRLHRRRIMIVCDLGRMIALACIPAAYLSGWLSMPLLYLVALVTGVFTVFFDVAYQSYLPALIQRADREVRSKSPTGPLAPIHPTKQASWGPRMRPASTRAFCAPRARIANARAPVLGGPGAFGPPGHQLPRPVFRPHLWWRPTANWR